MTVKETHSDILSKDTNLISAGEYHIDGRAHAIIQDKNSTKIQVVTTSKDDIDENDKPVVKVIPYETLFKFFLDYPVQY